MTVNLPEKHLEVEPLKVKEAKKRLAVIQKEFEQGFSFIGNHPRSVSFFGSTRFDKSNPYYKKAVRLAERIVKECGYSVVTGGGPGIMEAGNKGAKRAGGHSLGLTIQLPEEQATNPYVEESVGFHYFFARKVALAFSAEAYVFFPGGFGTLDEFFELVTLVQTHKIPRVPIILVGTKYWGRLQEFIDRTLLEEFGTVDEEDVKLYTVTDEEDEIIEIVRNAPVREE